MKSCNWPCRHARILQDVKPEGSDADPNDMHSLFEQVWVLLAIAGGIGLLALLHAITAAIRNETDLHDLRVRVGELRRDRIEKIKLAQEYKRLNAEPESARHAA